MTNLNLDDKSNLTNLRSLGQDVPRTDYVKYLGILLDDFLISKDHIPKLRDKLKPYVGVFYLHVVMIYQKKFKDTLLHLYLIGQNFVGQNFRWTK